MPGDPRLGIVLSGPQAPWGSPSPRGGHVRQVPPPTTTAPPLTPRDGAALPLPGAASAGQVCRSGRTHEPRRAERRFRAGRRPRQVWSWSGRYGGYQARDQRPPATFRAGGAATYRQVPGPHPRRAFRTHPTVLASALRWSGERHRDHEIAGALLPFQATDHAASHYRPPARARPRRPKMARTGANPLGAPRRGSPNCSFPGCGLTGQAGPCGMGTATKGRSWWTRNWRWRSACSAR